MDHQQSMRAPDSKEAAPSAAQSTKTAFPCESYKEKALWGFLHAASDSEDQPSTHDERRQLPKREAEGPSQKRSAGKPSRTRLLEMSGSSTSSCESIFIELCELSERLEAVEAAERRTSIATTASWRSAREAGGSASPPTVPSSSKRAPMTPEEYWLFQANYAPARGLPTDASPVMPAPRRPVVCAPAGPQRFRRPSHPPSTSEFTMQQLVEYVMEQLPLPDVDVAELQLVPDSKLAAPANDTATADETTSPLSEMRVPGDYAIEAVDRILRSGLLHSNSQPHEVVSMAKYHLVCIKEEDEGFLPPVVLPLEGDQQYVFWSLPRRPASVA
ncbi:hypothetical protein Emag_005054 [Eimeria magna]